MEKKLLFKWNRKNPPSSLISLLGRLFYHVSRRRRYQFLLLLGLTLVGSAAEVLSLGSVLPFIVVLTQPEKIFNNPLLAGTIQKMGISSPDGLIWPLSILFAVAALSAGAVRILLLWASTRLAFAAGADLSINVYRRTLYQPYPVHVGRSSSEIISGLTRKVGIVSDVLSAMVNVVTSSVLCLTILCTLFVIDPLVAAVSILSFGVCYGIIASQTRPRLVRNSICIAQEQTQNVKSLQEGLGAIRDVLLDGTQNVYSNVYRRSVQRLQRALGGNIYMNQAPRLALEAFGMVMIITLALVLSLQPGGVAATLPVLGALALSSVRMLPLLQQLYANWSTIMGSKASLVDALDLLDQPLPEESFQPAPAPLAFRQLMQFENVSFHYSSDSPWVLNNINITIPKGARVGFVGSTGSGKSTALDLLMSLLEPTQGRILVDGQPVTYQLRRAWQRVIAHVPQSIYLADSTIAENIAFGVPVEQIDMDRVRQAADQAQISQFIESRSEGYNVFVGERGIRLSGGQRQRIGIARALYKQATVLIFDEATSSLDSNTEEAVMSAIENLNRDLTILIVAHRITTLRNCDMIIQLEQGKVVAQGSYENFVNKNSGFQKLAKTAV